MTTYEFTSQQNRTFSDLSVRMWRAGLLVILVGLVRLGQGVMLLPASGLTMPVLIPLLHGISLTAIGVTIYRPADNLKHVVTSQGNDMAAVMTALRELTGGLGVVLGLVIINVILMVAEILGWGMR
jgi:hypothetical protein